MTVIDARTREAALDRLGAQRYDVVVVGGGVTGAGVALDAASRGLRTALVERVDLAAGTSRWSSKLVHGGLRYLAKGDIAIAWESAVERHHLLTAIAPHLIHPIATLLPLDEGTSPAMGALAETGIRFADALRMIRRTPARLLPRPRRVSAQDALLLAPSIDPDGLRGAIVYWDGQLEDDARLVTAIARTAAAHGADVVTHAAASEVREDALTVTDERTGRSIHVRARVVVSATGVWAGDLEPQLAVTPSRGTHLVVRSSALGDLRAQLTVPVPDHFGRYVFAMPQTGGLTYIGLTDDPAPGVDGIAPPVPEEDVDFLLSVINRGLARPLTRDDVVGRFAGLRPLVTPATSEAKGAMPTSDVSREHLLLDEPGRPLTIAGGKLTTYRRMAQDAVDAAVARLGRDEPCRTTRIPLVGAADERTLARIDAPRHLVRRYGTEAAAVWALREQAAWLGEPVVPGRPTIGAELLHGVLAEGALTPEDLIERRTRLSLVDADVPAAREAAQRALDLAAQG